MNPPGARHSCLRLRLADGGGGAAVVFVKGTWFASRFDLSITDGLDAWTCNATEAEVRQRAEQWDQLVPEYIELAERYLGSQQLGSHYKFEDAGNGQRRFAKLLHENVNMTECTSEAALLQQQSSMLSWTFEKQGTRLEWRWKCQPSSNNKQTTVGILDFLMDANIRLSGKESSKFMMVRKGNAWTDRLVDASPIKDVRIEMVNEKVNTNVTTPAVKNMEVKGKQKLKGDRLKAVWDDKKHAAFIKICLDQMRVGNKPHKTLNKLGYMNLEKEFYRQTGFHYYKDQLKNHWDSTRRDWQAWNALQNQTGIGWDETRGTYSQTDEWWAEFVKRFPGGDKFALRPLDHVDELDMLFGEGSGRTDAPQSPSSDATPSAGSRDSQSDPTPESHAEAEELNCPIIGNQNSTPSRSPRIEEFGETISPRYLNSAPAARPEKRPRLSDGMNWESCMKQVYDILMGGSRLLSPSAEDDPTSIPNVIALLNETRGIVRNSEEWLFAATKFRNESIRQLFYALGDPESRSAWIKREYKLAHG